MFSPLDERYVDEAVPLKPYLSQEARLEYMKRVEMALLETHAKRQGFKIKTTFRKVTAEVVKREEETTHHEVRALVRAMQKCLPKKQSAFVHLGATSSDIVDTANAWRYSDAWRDVIYPEYLRLCHVLARRAGEYKRVLQMGRTHGQWAVPVTFGYVLAHYVYRLRNALSAEFPCKGKMSGAVGDFSQFGYLYKDPVAFATEVMTRCGLELTPITTQILPQDDLVICLGRVNVAFSVIANLADDIRHLQRSEIAEVEERVTKDYVGSSTMPQKRNPWNSEHVKSLWKAFAPRYLTFIMDLISEHQRDLTNSASSRFLPEYLVGFYLAIRRMISVIDNLVIHEDHMERRVNKYPNYEKMYIWLASNRKDPQAHEKVRRATLEHTLHTLKIPYEATLSSIEDKEVAMKIVEDILEGV